MLELGKVSLFLHLIVGELHRQSLRIEHACVQEQCHRLSIALWEMINDESVGNRLAPFWGPDQEAKHRKIEMAEL